MLDDIGDLGTAYEGGFRVGWGDSRANNVESVVSEISGR